MSSATKVIPAIAQVIELQSTPRNLVAGNSSFSSGRMSAGRSTNVATPETMRMLARKMPTVTYGMSGASSSGVKPMAMTSTLRRMARAGSPNTYSWALAHVPCVSSRLRARARKWMAKSMASPSVSDESTATGMS